eukprot:COSAG03_NODE_13718_length_491_cov_1.456633_1_plen_136_part_10
MLLLFRRLLLSRRRFGPEDIEGFQAANLRTRATPPTPPCVLLGRRALHTERIDHGDFAVRVLPSLRSHGRVAVLLLSPPALVVCGVECANSACKHVPLQPAKERELSESESERESGSEREGARERQRERERETERQ